MRIWILVGVNLSLARFILTRFFRLTLAGFLERLFQVARRDQRGLNIKHILRVNHAAAPRQFRRGTHVMRAADGGFRGHEQTPRFGCLGLQALDFFQMRGRL